MRKKPPAARMVACKPAPRMARKGLPSNAGRLALFLAGFFSVRPGEMPPASGSHDEVYVDPAQDVPKRVDQKTSAKALVRPALAYLSRNRWRGCFI